jgi:hypothetical protein
MVAVVAVLIYIFILRPTILAKQFAHELEVAAPTDLQLVSEQYFDGMKADGAKLEVKLDSLRWNDWLRCRQMFEVNFVRPPSIKKPNYSIVSIQRYYSTPFGVRHLQGPYLITRGIERR